MNKKRFSLKEQLRYSWFNVLLAFITVVLVILVARAASIDRNSAECHTALMDNLHISLRMHLGPGGETSAWPPLFAEWQNQLDQYESGQAVPGVPECQR